MHARVVRSKHAVGSTEYASNSSASGLLVDSAKVPDVVFHSPFERTSPNVPRSGGTSTLSTSPAARLLDAIFIYVRYRGDNVMIKRSIKTRRGGRGVIFFSF